MPQINNVIKGKRPQTFKVSYAEHVTHVILVQAQDVDEAYDRAMEQLDQDNPVTHKKIFDKHTLSHVVKVPDNTKIADANPQFDDCDEYDDEE